MTSPVKIWRNQRVIRALLQKKGEIISWTIIRVPPGTHTSYAPYAVALVKLENGECITATCIDIPFDQITYGLSVRTVLRRLTPPDSDGVIPYGVKVTGLTI